MRLPTRTFHARQQRGRPRPHGMARGRVLRWGRTPCYPKRRPPGPGSTMAVLVVAYSRVAKGRPRGASAIVQSCARGIAGTAATPCRTQWWWRLSGVPRGSRLAEHAPTLDNGASHVPIAAGTIGRKWHGSCVVGHRCRACGRPYREDVRAERLRR
jgi:hypothetical protein